MNGSSSTTCEITRLVDAHFAGAIDPHDERRLREHLTDGCAICDERYRRRLLFAKLSGGGGLSAEDRIGRSLGFSVTKIEAPAAPRRVLLAARPAAVAFASLAAAAVLFLFLRPHPSPSLEEDGFASRGAALPTVQPPMDAAARISAFRISPRVEPGAEAGKPVLLSTAGASIRRTDELAFDYSNPGGKTHLMVFAVDETRRVYWFHPAWTDENENPTAIPIAMTTDQEKRHELREAIRHPFEGHRLTIHGLFVDRPITVREVETLVRTSESGEIMVTGANDDVIMLEVSQ